MQKPLMEAHDKTFTSGRVGIGSFDDMNDFSCCEDLWAESEYRAVVLRR